MHSCPKQTNFWLWVGLCKTGPWPTQLTNVDANRWSGCRQTRATPVPTLVRYEARNEIWNRRYHWTDQYIKYILTRHHFRYFPFYFLNKTALFHLIFFFFLKPWKQHRFVHSPNPNSLRINTFFSLRPLSSLVGWLSPLVAGCNSMK